MAEKQQVLIVEDEREIRELVALHLLRQGYKVTEVGSVEEAESVLASQKFSLFVLDWMLPGKAGVELIPQIKQQHPQATVLMLTAKTEPQDIVEGLEKGADDYVTKPFEPAVLIARVKALLRRSSSLEEVVGDQITLGSLYLNLATYKISVQNEELHLTPSEFKLLTALVQNHGKVLTRESLIEQIQGEGVNVVGRTVDTHVFGLRKKLGVWGDNIETIRGVGYRVRSDLI